MRHTFPLNKEHGMRRVRGILELRDVSKNDVEVAAHGEVEPCGGVLRAVREILVTRRLHLHNPRDAARLFCCFWFLVFFGGEGGG